MGTLLEKRTSSEAHQFRSAPVQMRTSSYQCTRHLEILTNFM
jgi:hypothetical protein